MGAKLGDFCTQPHAAEYEQNWVMMSVKAQKETGRGVRVRRNAISLAVVLFFALFMMTWLCDFAAANSWRQRKSEPDSDGDSLLPLQPRPPHQRLWFRRTGFTFPTRTPIRLLVFANGLTATGNMAPSATISGTATTLNGPQYMAFDSVHDRLFVANVGTATNLGTILIFDSASTLNGNVAPTRTIGGTVSGLVSPSDVAYDATHDALYVLDATDILVYNTISNPAVTGDRVPDRDITVSFNLTAILSGRNQ